MNRLVSLVTFLLINSAPAASELLQCDGVWINRSCDGVISAALSERPFREQTQQQREQYLKELWLSELENELFSGRRIHKVAISSERAQVVCRTSQYSLGQCREIIDEIRQSLEVTLAAKAPPVRDGSSAESLEPKQIDHTAIYINYSRGQSLSRRRHRTPPVVSPPRHRAHHPRPGSCPSSGRNRWEQGHSPHPRNIKRAPDMPRQSPSVAGRIISSRAGV